uniref:Uncharacterized protein n=1 Tax=Anguilla anguilla TaxID=7936 RepID=A0A0E9PHT2_ANGAN
MVCIPLVKGLEFWGLGVFMAPMTRDSVDLHALTSHSSPTLNARKQLQS